MLWINQIYYTEPHDPSLPISASNSNPCRSTPLDGVPGEHPQFWCQNAWAKSIYQHLTLERTRNNKSNVRVVKDTFLLVMANLDLEKIWIWSLLYPFHLLQDMYVTWKPTWRVACRCYALRLEVSWVRTELHQWQGASPPTEPRKSTILKPI